MARPIYILCSNFKEIGCRKVGEKMHCFLVTKSSQNVAFFYAILPRFGGECQKFAVESVTWVSVSL